MKENFKIIISVQLIAVFFLISGTAKSQLTTTNTAPYNSAAYLVQNVLTGQGVTVSNISFTGDSIQLGHFNGVNSNIGLNEGIIMSSGDIADAPGPNSIGSTTTSLSNAGDTDLDQLSGNTTYDAAILEFDFVPVGDTVEFRYVFGSEEYPEFVNSTYNDAFGFFISGPGITGSYTNSAENIALIPGTSTPVTINNVNSGSNSSYYVDNTSGTTVEYDGFTVVLTAKRAVQCGQTYHMKIAVADAGDGSYDSGVFLEAGSLFSSSVTVSLDSTSLIGGNTVVEGCNQATINFTRSDTNDADTVHFDILGNAVNGSDYNFIADSVLFAQGDSAVSVNINPIADGIPEGTDTVTIKVYTITACNDTVIQTVSIYIVDTYSINVQAFNDTVNCPGDSAMLVASVSYGLPPFSYSWSNGMTGDTIYVPVNQNDTFIVSVTDSCGIATATDTAYTFIQQVPVNLTVSGDQSPLCPGDAITLYSQVSGGSQPYAYNWSNGDTSDTAVVSPASDTTYYLTVTDRCGATAQDSISITMPNYPPLSLSSNDTTVQCPGDIALLYASATGGAGNYTYSWSSGTSGDTATVSVNSDQYISVTATDQCGNSITDSSFVQLQQFPNLEVSVNDTTLTCTGDTINVAVAVTGGNSPYSVQWSNGDTGMTSNYVVYQTTDFYVTIYDACNRSETDTFTVTIPVYDALQVDAGQDQEVHCAGESVLLPGSAEGGAGAYGYAWYSGGDFISGSDTADSGPVDDYTKFVFMVNDQCGNEARDSMYVDVPEYAPLVVEADSDQTICAGETAFMFAAVTGGDGDYFYSWEGENISGNSDTSHISAQPTGTGGYTVNVTDGCSLEAYDNVDVSVLQCEVTVPNVFSPNGDGINETFSIVNLEHYPGSRIAIFDRWGLKIYEDDDYQNDWSGEGSSAGTFYYILTLSDGRVMKGYVEMMK